jgi:hypothetical protein
MDFLLNGVRDGCTGFSKTGLWNLCHYLGRSLGEDTYTE